MAPANAFAYKHQRYGKYCYTTSAAFCTLVGVISQASDGLSPLYMVNTTKYYNDGPAILNDSLHSPPSPTDESSKHTFINKLGERTGKSIAIIQPNNG